MLRRHLSLVGVVLLCTAIAAAQSESQEKTESTEESSIKKLLEEGKDAHDSKEYDLAIAKFQEGYAARPDFLGSAPEFLNHKGLSLKLRAVGNYNNGVRSKDAAEKTELKEKAGADLADALASFSQALKLLNTGDASGVDPETIMGARSDSLKFGIEIISLMNRTLLGSDAVKDDARLIVGEYVKHEHDSAKRMEAHLVLGTYLAGVSDHDGAGEIYRSALEIDKKNPEALYGLGMSLVFTGDDDPDAAKRQEGLNYLQYYLDTAPQDHRLRSWAEKIVEELKDMNLKPQKISEN